MVDGWLPQLTAGVAPSVQTWLLPVSPPENGLYRWWLNASLRGSLPASQPRRYTVPLYVNKGQFLRSLQVTSEQDVVLLLTDKTGHVLWRAAGPVTDSKAGRAHQFPEIGAALNFGYVALATRAAIMFTARWAESAAPSCQPTIWLVWSPARKMRPWGWIHTS